MCSVKRCSWNFQEHQNSQSCHLIKKKNYGTGVFLWILWKFQEHFFHRTPLVAASVASQIINYVDALLVSEKKLDDFFPTARFLLDIFLKPYRLGRGSSGRWILFYAKHDISSPLLTGHKLPDNVKCTFIETNKTNKKLLFFVCIIPINLLPYRTKQKTKLSGGG